MEALPGYAPQRTFVMIPPLDDPVTNTFAGSPPYMESVHRTMLTMASESLPPLCVSVSLVAPSQQR
jgi:hypothetical protein